MERHQEDEMRSIIYKALVKLLLLVVAFNQQETSLNFEPMLNKAKLTFRSCAT